MLTRQMLGKVACNVCSTQAEAVLEMSSQLHALGLRQITLAMPCNNAVEQGSLQALTSAMPAMPLKIPKNLCGVEPEHRQSVMVSSTWPDWVLEVQSLVQYANKDSTTRRIPAAPHAMQL